MRTHFAKMAVLPSLALAMLIASPRPTPRNICRRKLLTSTGITQHHHWPMMPKPIRTTGWVPFVR